MIIDYNEIDNHCRAMVKWFNSNGYTTKSCCEGHEKLNTRFVIMFEESVSDDKIANLISKYSNEYNHSPFRGRFIKWCRLMSGKVIFNWEYCVAGESAADNQLQAYLDLSILKQLNKEEFTDYLIDREDAIISMSDDNG